MTITSIMCIACNFNFVVGESNKTETSDLNNM